MKMNGLEWVAWVLMVVGGLNWGLVGLFGVDAVVWVLGLDSVLSQVVYVLVGLSALFWIWKTFKK